MEEVITKKRGDGEAGQPESTRGGRVYIPNVDIIEKEDELQVVADVPGAKAENIEVTYEKGILEFRAKVEPRQEEGKVRYLLREYAVGDYQRSFRLGEHIDASKIVAELKEGVLTLHLPKAEPAKRRQIEVKQG